MLNHIEHQGVLVHDCQSPGNRRADQVVPAHPNGIQLSARRFLLLISTLGFRGVDDSRSILYQIRDGAYDGPVLTEGVLAKSIDDWDPLGDGSRHVRQFGHPVAFGVPKGAILKGQPAPNANVFAVKWRVCARVLDREGGYLLWNTQPIELTRQTQAVEWLQFRLNDQEDDIEILQPAQPLRQKEFESGPAFCSADLGPMNQTYTQAVPFTTDGLEWVDVNHFNKYLNSDNPGVLAALKYRFNRERGRYEWVETGPVLGTGMHEASIAPWRGDWIVAVRPRDLGPVGWCRVNDPFGETPRIVYPSEPVVRAPLTAYACPDGVIRLFTGCPEVSPYKGFRNPLYCWEIDPDAGFTATNCRVILDTYEAGIKISKEHNPIVDMPKLLPHVGGGRQCFVHRVRSAALLNNDPAYGGFHPLTDDDFASTAIYHADLVYGESYPGCWEFWGAKL